MRRLMSLLIIGLAVTAVPCTIFVVSRGGQVLVGANEDFGQVAMTPKHWIQFHPKKPGEKFGYVAFGFPAYPQFPQAAINEAGLFYDYNALKFKDVGRPGKPPLTVEALEKVMTQCKTVKEAVEFMVGYDDFPSSAGQMVLGDATGDSAIAERHTSTPRKEGDFQIGTNFRTSETPNDQIVCPRWRACNTELGKGAAVSVESVRALCEKVKMSNFGGLTSYTTVCGLKAAKVYLFRAEDFATVTVIDVAAELKKGDRRVDMNVLMAELGKAYRSDRAISSGFLSL